jgi:hypothetical protein
MECWRHKSSGMWHCCCVFLKFQRHSEALWHGHISQRHTVASQKIWLFSNTAVRTSFLLTNCLEFHILVLIWCTPVVPKLFRTTAPLVPYTHPQRPPTFF